MTGATEKIKIAIYDMDKTITLRASYNGFLIHMAKNRAPWRFLLVPVLPIGLLFYGLKIWDRRRLKEFSQQLLLGSRVNMADLQPYLEDHADGLMQGNLYPQIPPRIAEEKAQGYRHVMATASYRLYVEPFAARLNFDSVIATNLAQDDGGNVLAKIDGQNCYDVAKLDKIEDWMKAQGLRRDECYIRAYSDHISDAPLLNFADEAFATNPHEPLAKLAAEKGWAVIDWRRS